jgi:peptide-methionine (S)-S-oxide reductase
VPERRVWLACLVLGGVAAWSGAARSAAPAPPEKAAPAPAALARATFAGGCFWCMEQPFDALDGVVSTTSGYTGGRTVKPSYEEVSSGGTGHAEAVQVVYDPTRVGYEKLLHVFWRNIDPFDARGQFCDKGTQYRSAIFVQDEEQRRLAETSKRELQARFKEPIVTEIVAAAEFYPAEGYHQDYYKKNPARYRFYRFGCGRDGRLKQVWGKEAGAGEH